MSKPMAVLVIATILATLAISFAPLLMTRWRGVTFGRRLLNLILGKW